MLKITSKVVKFYQVAGIIKKTDKNTYVKQLRIVS